MVYVSNEPREKGFLGGGGPLEPSLHGKRWDRWSKLLGLGSEGVGRNSKRVLCTVWSLKGIIHI